MKKLILLLIITIVPITIKAQTLEETMDYLNANILNYAYDKNGALTCESNYCDITTGYLVTSGERTSFDRMYLKDIKSITYSTNSEGLIVISLLGKVVSYQSDYRGNFNREDLNVSNFKIPLKSSTPIDNVNRIIKAMKHAAELGGAKLINEDLFKD